MRKFRCWGPAFGRFIEDNQEKTGTTLVSVAATAVVLAGTRVEEAHVAAAADATTTLGEAPAMHVRLMMQPPDVRRPQREGSSLHHRGLTRLEASRKIQ